MNNCQIRGCRNLEHRCKDCGRVVQTIGLGDPPCKKSDWCNDYEENYDHIVDANKMVLLEERIAMLEEGLDQLTEVVKKMSDYIREKSG